jgi:hypothetical protein
MAKKKLFLFGMALFLVLPAFSQEANKPSPISIGMKATLDFIGDDSTVQTGPSQIFAGSSLPQRIVEGTASEFQGGISVFFDAKFIEFSINFLIGADTFQIERVLGVDVNYDPDVSLNISTGFSLLGKFPFRISKLTLAPAFGTEYRFMIARAASEFLDDEETIQNEFQSIYNTFLIKFGGIVDFDLTNRLYLRGNLLGSFNTAMFSDGFPYKAEGGVQIQLGIGYRF